MTNNFPRMLALILAISIFAAVVVAQAPSTGASSEISPVGDWRGDSICLVKPSACHDEDSLYHVKGIPGKPGQFSMQADTIVDGKPVNMGDAGCTYEAKERILTCHSSGGSLVFTVTEKTMKGTMFRPDKTRWRDISLKKVS